MQQIIDFFLQPYLETSYLLICLEFFAMVTGIMSVYYAKKENILVFPVGIVSTATYVYLLSQWQMYGDLIINIYYTLMSLYGWWVWCRVIDEQTHQHTLITRMSRKDYFSTFAIFIFTSVFVIFIYRYYEVMPTSLGFMESAEHAWTNISSGSIAKLREAMPFIDTFTTGAAFSAMWLMANKKLESWLAWIVVNIASVPLYFIKGYGFTGIQYFVFLVLAIYGYKEWVKNLEAQKATDI